MKLTLSCSICGSITFKRRVEDSVECKECSNIIDLSALKNCQLISLGKEGN